MRRETCPSNGIDDNPSVCSGKPRGLDRLPLQSSLEPAERWCGKEENEEGGDEGNRSLPFERCRLICQGSACQKTTYSESWIACHNGEACHGSRFRKSTVMCWEASTCAQASFVQSVVLCDQPTSCDMATWDVESCCRGKGCPTDFAFSSSCDEFASPTTKTSDIVRKGYLLAFSVIVWLVYRSIVVCAGRKSSIKAGTRCHGRQR